jgi:DNA-binding transcriptional LysR family regulator
MATLADAPTPFTGRLPDQVEPALDAGPIPPDPVSGRDLAAFVAAAETGSVQGAAHRLSLTQSAATKRIQALENRLGVRLLDRSRTGVRLTEAGRLLYPEAREALAALRRTERTVPRSCMRSLRVAASQTVGEALLPRWLADFRAARPEVQLHVELTNSPGVLRRIRDGDASIGFVEGLDALTGLETQAVARDEIVVVVDAAHRWRRRSALRAAELRDEPYISREYGSGTRAVAEAALRRVGVTLEPAVETASLQSVKHSLMSGGFALISRLTVLDEVRAGTLHALSVNDADLRRTLHAVRTRRADELGMPAALWRWLRAHVQLA